MAQKPDIAAAKAKKQKIILAVAGIALVGLAVMQGPKLLKGDSPPVPATAETSTAPVGTGTAAPTPVAVVVTSPSVTSKPAAYVAGVGLPGGSKVVVASSQLASFTLFEVKDPFVQQADDTAATDAAAAGSAAAGSAASTTPEATGATGASAAPPPPPIAYATIMLNGKPQQLQVKVDKEFPKGAPLFVLVSLKKKQAKIGVAGGSFDDGKNVTLTLGKKLTLVDTATGVRYELKLVYTGTAPEQIEGFSTAPDQSAAPAPDAGTTAVATPTP
jgi:hypothetical protein